MVEKEMRMKRLTRLSMLFLVAWAAFGQTAPGASGGRGGGRGGLNAGPQIIPLWPNGVPGALGDSDADKPEMTFYRGGRSGTAVIIAPGGAYRNLSMESEGRQKRIGSTPWGSAHSC